MTWMLLLGLLFLRSSLPFEMEDCLVHKLDLAWTYAVAVGREGHGRRGGQCMLEAARRGGDPMQRVFRR